MSAYDSLSVLLIEDNPGDVRLIEKRLERGETSLLAADFELRHAESLPNGLEILAETHVDLLLLDLGLPGSSGLETLERALEAVEDVPIVVLTGLEDRSVAVEAIEVGAQDYLGKDDLTGHELARSMRYAIERKKRERELRRYEEIIENAPMSIFRLSADAEFVDLNPATAATFGADSPETLLGSSFLEVCCCPEQWESFVAVLEDGVATGELQLEDLDGESFWGLLTAYEFEEDGETYVDCFLKDVTEQKRRRQRLEDQNEKLELLNRIVRHDIRNDMQVALGMAQLLEEEIEGERATEYLENVIESSNHVVELTRTVRDLMETMLEDESEGTEAIDLVGVLREELGELEDSYGEVETHFSTEADPLRVEANEMLESVFRNVLSNAVQHNDQETPTIEVTIEDEGDRALVRVADDGPGIPDAQKEEVFGKGQKGLESDGTGIGLYLVATLVDSYGGDVWVEDNDPRGSVFVVELEKVSQNGPGVSQTLEPTVNN